MKIVFVTPMGIDRPSGQRYFNIAKGLVARGHAVRILALHPDLEQCRQRRFEQYGVEVWYMGQMHAKKRGTTPVRFSPLQLLRVVVQSTLGLVRGIVASPADVYHLGKPQPINGIAALLGICLLQQRSFFVDCDDDEVSSNRLNSGWQRAVFAFWQRLIVSVAAGSTVNTLYLRDRNLREGRGPVVYVPNGVDPARFQRPPALVVQGMRHALQLEDRRVIGYVGTLALQNHPVDLLLDAFALIRGQFPDAVLLLIGGGEDMPLLQRQTVARGYGDAVLFTGHVDQRGLPVLLALVDITVDPVYDNTVARSRSPLKLFESMALGIPVVTGDVGDRLFLLDDGRAGILVQPGHAGALAEGLTRLLADGELVAAMGRHGEHLVASRYAWSHLARSWVRLYDRECDDGLG